MNAQTGKARQDRLALLRDKLKHTDMGGGGSAGFWSPKEGRSVIRILPEAGEMEYFFQEVGRHNFPPDNKKSVYCPKFTSHNALPCPVCEIVDDLYKGDKALQAMAGNLRVRKSYWMNVIVRGTKEGEEDSGPFIYTPGQTVFSSVAALISDPDYGDIMSPTEGLDIIVERTGQGLQTEYQVKPRRNSSPLSNDEKQIDDWLAKARDLTWVEVGDDPEQDKELGKGHSLYLLPYDRIVKEFDLDEGIAVDVDEDEEEVAPKKTSAPAPARRTSKVDDDLDDELGIEDDEVVDAVPQAKQEIVNRQARRAIRR